MAALVTTFFALGHAKPTLTISHARPFSVWAETQEELASLYGEDTESFDSWEAYWCGEDEYAEVVTLNGRIIGAFNRALSQEDVAAIWGVDRMEKRAFINRIRSLSNIDGDMLPELTRQQQSNFLRDPMRYFLDADEIQSDAIMREIEVRQETAKGSAVAQTKAEFGQETNKKSSAKPSRAKKQKVRVDGQREMLLPITGGVKEAATTETRTSSRKTG